MEEEVLTKPGIIYMSRIPPSMNPLKLRNMLSQFGEVGRVFLQPEGIYLFIFFRVLHLISKSFFLLL